ncbi:hypothetical protein ASD15_12155 [Massilia sp. Root351]|jgi:hypothetical protein|uniref:hypothetical protein n=1 Tax=Massilia sp. Root351 TaxID=1736522 RepID=UPI000710FB5B|nr:hypothetical protein [Massilia sp. Root351]KQV80681.1 hypothetical protein ASD15_12155 [Massilia sp. Root351]
MTHLRCIAALCGCVFSAGAAGLPPGWTPVPDQTLEERRGGFDTGSGLLVSLGVERLVAINGGTVASSQFHIADLARITPGEALQAQAAIQPLLVQNGMGNAAPAGVPALFIQNTVNDQLIQSQTTINAAVSSLSMLTSTNFESSMRVALSSALAPR